MTTHLVRPQTEPRAGEPEPSSSRIPGVDRDFSSPILVRVASGDHHLLATACFAGDDVVVTIGGGQKPHVGCVVIAQPHPSAADPTLQSCTSSVISIPPHREESIARHVAETLARTLGVVVVVAAGVHSDGLTRGGIATFLRLGRRLARELAQKLLQAEAGAPRRARK